MNQVLIEPAPARMRRFGDAARMVGIVLAVVGMLAFSLWVTRGPDFVDHVTVVNGTAYDLDVDVTGAARDGWLPMNVVLHRSSTTTDDVVDQSNTWIFRFSHEGTPVGELRLSRDGLEKGGWRVVVPDDVERRLRAVDPGGDA